MKEPKNRMVKSPQEPRDQEMEAKAEMVLVRALSPLHEGAFFNTGETFTLDATRAAALGGLVEIVNRQESTGHQ